MKYVCLVAFPGTKYRTIDKDGGPIFFKNVRDAARTAELLMEQNHLLPSQCDYIIFRELDEDDY